MCSLTDPCIITRQDLGIPEPASIHPPVHALQQRTFVIARCHQQRACSPPLPPIYIEYIYHITCINQYTMHITMNRYSNTRRNLPSTLKRQWRSLSDPFRMAPLDILMPPEPPAARCRRPMGGVCRCVAPWWWWPQWRWRWRWR